jgi:hypothetical protein
MASYQHARDQFIATAAQQGLPLATITKLLRYATTLQRLAEAQCNGDWPADNGERKTVECSRCGSGWAPSSMVRDTTAPKIAGFKHHGSATDLPMQTTRAKQYPRICKDCRTQDLVTALLQGTPFKPYFQGDPRGAVLQLMPLDASQDDMYCGRVRGVYVPARS